MLDRKLYSTPTGERPKPVGRHFVRAYARVSEAASCLELASRELIGGRQARQLRSLAAALRTLPLLSLGLGIEGGL
jgi:hypothetical protein